MRECIVHFNLVSRGRTKALRGLIFVKKNEQPSVADLLQCFADMGLKVKPADEGKLVFKSVQSEDPFVLEGISFDFGNKKEKDDPALKALANHFIDDRSKSL